MIIRGSYSTAGGNVFCVSHCHTNSLGDTLCPVVIRSISENFCDYHGTWLFPGCNHRNFQKWVITTELLGHDVSRGNLHDTMRHGKHYHRQYSTCMFICLDGTILGGISIFFFFFFFFFRCS